MKKTIATIISCITMASLLCGCDININIPKSEKSTKEKTGAEEIYESQDGWSVKYDSAQIEMSETEGGVSFRYITETTDELGPIAESDDQQVNDSASAENVLTVSYHPDQMPEEVLYEMICDYDDESVLRYEGPFDAGMVDWKFGATVGDAFTEDGLKEFNAIEHNGGTILIETLLHGIEEDETQSQAICDAIGSVLDSWQWTNHNPQTEYDYIPGEYTCVYEETSGDETVNVTYTLVLNRNHTGYMYSEQLAGLTWNTKQIVIPGENQTRDFTVEGETLFLEIEGDWSEWIEFTKVGDPTTITSTYSIDTYEGSKVTIDSANIIYQKESDEPEESEMIPVGAVVMAPGRDVILLEDEEYYYVADRTKKLVTVAAKEMRYTTAPEPVDTVDGEASIISPVEVELDLDSLEPGVYPVSIDNSQNDAVMYNDGVQSLVCEVFTLDRYAAADVENIKVGDVLVLLGEEHEIKSVEKIGEEVAINGGLEVGGIDLAIDPDSDGDYYIYMGWDWDNTYTSHGQHVFELSEDVVLTDNSVHPKTVTTAEEDAVGEYFMFHDKDSTWNEYNTRIEIDESGKITKINRIFVP